MAAFVVPFGREGASDRAARAFLRAWLGTHGRALEVENVPGEGGLLGVRHANAMAAEGQAVWLLSTPTTHVLLPARLGESAAPHASFAPVLGLGSAPNVLLAASRLGVRTLDELLSLARRARLTYASAGSGQTIDVCTRELMRRAGISMAHRPYERGSVLAYAGLASGEADVYFDNLLGCSDRLASGEVRALAVSSAARSPALPVVPALAERLPGYALDVWIGVVAAGIEARDREDASALAGDVRLRGELESLGLAGGPLPAAAFAAAVRDSAGSWSRAALSPGS